jgi:polysaccharide biosynthesis transport protein
MSPQSPALPTRLSAIPQVYLQPGLTLRQIRSIFHAYRKQSLLILLSIVMLGGVVSLLLPRTYIATATLMVDFDVNDPLGGKEFPTSLMSNYLATQRDLIQSPAVLLPAIATAKLTSDPQYTAGYRQGSGDVSNWVMDKVLKNLKVELGEYGSQFIYISYSANSAAEAANLANIIAHIYADQHFHRVNDPASERADRYTAQLAQLKQDVDTAQAKVSQFQQRSGSVEYDSKMDLSDERLTDLEHRLLEAQEMRRTTQMNASTGSAFQSSALSSNTVQTLKSTLATQTARLAELRQTLGPNHPDILQLQSQIAATQNSLNSELSTYSGNAQSDFENASKLESELQTAVDQQRAKVLQTRQIQDDGATYLRALQAAQTLYQHALDGYNQVMLTSSGRYSNVSFVAEATPPVKASKPKTLLNIILAVVTGSALALLGPLVFELLNRRVRCRDDLERELGIPVLIELGRPALEGGVA